MTVSATIATPQEAPLHALVAAYEAMEAPLALRELRAEAAACARNLTLPTLKDEEWRFTPLAGLKGLTFSAASHALVPVTRDEVAAFLLPEAATRRLVFVDGVYAPELSDLAGLGEGLAVTRFAEASVEHRNAIASYLGTLAPKTELFPAVNAACLSDGALVAVSREHASPAPLHLLYVSSGRQGAIATTPRCLVVLDAESQLTLVEDHVHLASAPVLVNAVTELVLKGAARLKHVKLQREAAEAFSFAHTAVSLDRAASYRSVSLALGARLSRHDLRIVQQGEGAEATLDGLAYVTGDRLADTHTVMDHTRPNGTSSQRHRCIVDGAGRAVFNGRVIVRKEAQLTNSSQSSRNLLLSDKARVDTKPQLEIFADDVKCTHGATVGQLESEELFYLRSRGLSEEEARQLLIYAFAAEIVEAIPVESLREALRRHVSAAVAGR